MAKTYKKIAIFSLIVNLFLLAYLVNIKLNLKQKFKTLLNKIQQVEVAQDKVSQPKKPRKSPYLNKVELFTIFSNPKQEIVFLGDSITAAISWTELFRNPNISSRGIDGDKTYTLVNRLAEVTESQPQKIFLMVGINDLFEVADPEEVQAKYYDLLSQIKAATPNSKVYIQSVLPINSELVYVAYHNKKRKKNNQTEVSNEIISSLNATLEKFAQEFNYEYIDLYSHFLDNNQQLKSEYTYDGIHLTSAGYLQWRKLIAKYI